MRHLSVDIETFSSVPLAKAGLYKYAQSSDFQVLLIAWSLDGAPVQVMDLTVGTIPPPLQSALFDPDTVKHAYNAAFEWYCLSRFFCVPEPGRGFGFDRNQWLRQWRCTRLHGLYCGYTASLDATGKALGLPQDKQKLAVGKALIRYFCTPCSPTAANGGRTRNLPQHDPDKWNLFVEYCRQDVVTEMEIERRLSNFPVPEQVEAQWRTDQVINSRGVATDREMVQGALELDAAVRDGLLAEARELTGLENPGSVAQLTAWLEDEIQDKIPNLRKDTVRELLDKGAPSGVAARMLEIRQELGKTSTKKYNAIETAACADGRLRGLLQFYGANRTGRWAGRIVQPQNLPRTYIAGELLPMARRLVENRQSDALRWICGSIPDTLSQLIRTALVASPGNRLIDADFSAIEARVISWLAGEQWALETFRTHGKIYEATASMLYGVPIEKIKKGNPEYALRQYGKAATLALGYQGGNTALITAGHLPKDTPEEQLTDIKIRWRKSNPSIVRLWYGVQEAALQAVQTGQPATFRGLTFARECDVAGGLDFLTIRVPSGRKLYYAKPHMTKNRFGEDSLAYWGINQTSRRWQETETYGGKLTENCVQAIARDCLAEAIERLEAAGYPVVFHVHDEVVIDTDRGSLEDVIQIMSQPPAWAPDLPLTADGWENDFFKKD